MFGAFALDVSNFQAGSFGTPAFFLAAFSDILPDLIAHHLMTASRAVIPFAGRTEASGARDNRRDNRNVRGQARSAYFAVLTSLRNSVIQSSEPMPRHSPMKLNAVRAKPLPVQA